MKELHLEVCQPHHLSDLMHLWNHPDVMFYVGFPEGLNATMASMEKWYQSIQNSPDTQSVMIYHDQLGFCGETYYRVNQSQAIVDIKLLPHARSQGIAFEAFSDCLDTLFRQYPYVEAIVDPHRDNRKAHRLYQKLGFIESSEQPHQDHLVYTLNLASFKPAPATLEKAIAIRSIEAKDFPLVYALGYQQEHYRWQETNGPYFEQAAPISYETFLAKEADNLCQSIRTKAITYHDTYIGIVSYYYESERTRWIEMGIVIEDERYWSKGISSFVLPQWWAHLFTTLPIDRVGFTTWSGNPGMIRVGQKCGMKQEATLRHVRYYQGTYYDSIKFGLTREEYKQMERIQQSIHTIKDPQEKSMLCETLLRMNPDHFGIEESILDYIDSSQKLTVLAYDQRGFIVLDILHPGVMDIHVMAIDPHYHRQGIGSCLIQAALFEARRRGCHLLTVKTLDAKHPSIAYRNTRQFYQAMGFQALETFPTYWNVENPCLMMTISV